MSTIAAALREAQEKIDRLDAEVLLAHLLRKQRSYLLAWPEQALDDETLAQFNTLIARRRSGEPLAYLSGWKEFWSLLLQVTPATLIPRPETELLVEAALEKIPPAANWRIADLGTGSGAIALAIASERPRCRVVATDISSAALEVAQANAARLKLSNVEFRQGSWHDALKQGECFQLIASNPPYIDATDTHLQRDGLPYEPQTALTPGKDGMSALQIIATQMKPHLCQPAWLLLEHGYDQGARVRALLQQQGYSEVITRRDLSDNERMTQGRLKQMKMLQLPRPLVNTILAQAQQSPENEVCGLIGGRHGQAERCYPIDNTALDQARRYQMDPKEQIDAMRQMRDNGEELIAIYHSHPHAPALPSPTDLAEAAYPEAAYLIVSLNTVGVLEMTAFRIKDKQARELALELV